MHCSWKAGNWFLFLVVTVVSHDGDSFCIFQHPFFGCVVVRRYYIMLMRYTPTREYFCCAYGFTADFNNLIPLRE